MKELILASIADLGAAYRRGSDSQITPVFAAYMASHSTEQFLQETLSVIHTLKTGEVTRGNLAQTVAQYVINHAGVYLDSGDDRVLGEANVLLNNTLKSLRKEMTPRSLEARFQELITHVYPHSSMTVVQSPLTLSAEQRVAIRAALAAKFPEAYPTFSVDKSLLGGIRLFINGKLIDRSWQHTVRHLLQSLSIS